MATTYYKTFDYYNLQPSGRLHMITNFKSMLQSTDVTCGPACAIMVLNYLGEAAPSEEEMAKLCKTRRVLGTRLKDLIAGIKKVTALKVVSSYNTKNKNGISFETYQDFKNFAIASIDKNIPTILENCEYGGHYQVLIGFDEVNPKNPEEDILIFADPSDFYDGKRDGYLYTSAERFYYMWFDYRCMERAARFRGYLQILK